MPNFHLVRKVRQHRSADRSPHAIFGLDLHELAQPRDIWLECTVSSLSASAIMEAFRTGKFVNRVLCGSVNSSGLIPFREHVRMLAIGSAHATWNMGMRLVPRRLGSMFHRLSRPLINAIRRGGRHF
jgi:hypothetical protein